MSGGGNMIHIVEDSVRDDLMRQFWLLVGNRCEPDASGNVVPWCIAIRFANCRVKTYMGNFIRRCSFPNLLASDCIGDENILVLHGGNASIDKAEVVAEVDPNNLVIQVLSQERQNSLNVAQCANGVVVSIS